MRRVVCRVNAELRRGVGCGGRIADWKSAIQQVGNLRYGGAARWDGAPYPHTAGGRFAEFDEGAEGVRIVVDSPSLG